MFTIRVIRPCGRQDHYETDFYRKFLDPNESADCPAQWNVEFKMNGDKFGHLHGVRVCDSEEGGASSVFVMNSEGATIDTIYPRKGPRFA